MTSAEDEHPFEERRHGAAAFVRMLHAGQTLELGGAPAWHHLDRVSRLLQRVVEATGEGVSGDRRTISLAALAHDALEDVPGLSEESLRPVFGDAGLEIILGMTNREGLAGVEGYVRQVAGASEAVRLTKLADLADNCTSVLHALRRPGLPWVRGRFLPAVSPMVAALLPTRFDVYPRAAELLKELVTSCYSSLLEELDRYELDGYVEEALAAIERLSRTVAAGTVDTSTAPGKAETVHSLQTDDARGHAMFNAREALEICFEARDRRFDSPAELGQFVEKVVRTVNRGIVKEGHLLREVDAPRKPYPPAADLPVRYERFLHELLRRLQEQPAGDDAVDLGAWIDFHVDINDHFFVDGCGRIARILVAWTRMREGRPLPRYPDREAHYAAVNPPEWARVAAYYRRLDQQDEKR